MNFSTLTYTIEHRIALITMNRPERRNALDDVMMRELTDALTSVNKNNGSRIVILTGAGTTFCAGMDLDYLQKYSHMTHEQNLEDARNLVKLLILIQNLKKPVIAMLNGPALGGGCGIAAACDFVFAAKSNTKIGAPEVKLGFLPAVILPFLVKRMGEGKAREFVLRGDIVGASKAHELGLVTEVIEDDLLKSRTTEFAEQFAGSVSASSVGLTKELLSRFHDMNITEALEYAANLNALTRKTEDFQKGIQSFLKKEKLRW